MQRLIDFEPVDPHVAEDDKPRLSKQCRVILARLQQGPATNLELYEICLRPAARVHDLNRHGYRITSRHVGNAEWVYTLG